MAAPAPAPAPPPPPGAEDLARLVAEMQAGLEEGVRRGALQRDPYAALVAALSRTLSVFPALVRAVEASRQPLGAAEREALAGAMAAEAGRAIRGVAAEVVRAAHRRALATAALGIVALVAAAGACGFLAGRASLAREVVVAEAGLRLEAGAARAWLELIRANPDPRPLLGRATVRAAGEGRYYDGVTLWQVPPSPPPRR
ncbi:hypothetical protein [Roseicella aquatilis]|uniref:Uncharacterized protein n=1 Tax=Roseicella aquatilis TaxID=2527868 RepID=A0A4R4DK85_9PROT|nr:hypothetical protein [Roseicella aquatilis]TCZ61145.1 hypothetical protein EXY23_13530 [Roseicella aquatilis]